VTTIIEKCLVPGGENREICCFEVKKNLLEMYSKQFTATGIYIVIRCLGCFTLQRLEKSAKGKSSQLVLLKRYY
jgi:hypothetical protein